MGTWIYGLLFPWLTSSSVIHILSLVSGLVPRENDYNSTSFLRTNASSHSNTPESVCACAHTHIPHALTHTDFGTDCFFPITSDQTFFIYGKFTYPWILESQQVKDLSQLLCPCKPHSKTLRACCHSFPSICPSLLTFWLKSTHFSKSYEHLMRSIFLSPRASSAFLVKYITCVLVFLLQQNFL